MSYPQDRSRRINYWSLVAGHALAVSIGLFYGYWLGGMFWGLLVVCELSIALDVVAIRSGTYGARYAPPPQKFGGYRRDALDTQHFYVGGCHVFIYIVKTAPRVFIGGGPPQVDPGNEGEADLVEIEALAERLNLPRLREIASIRRAAPIAIDRELAVPPDA